MKIQTLIIDFGSQYTQLIARRIRELHFYAEIRPFFISLSELKEISPQNIIFSGGPASVYDQDIPQPEEGVLNFIVENKIPVLGICYGMQVLTDFFGGKVSASPEREFGKATLSLDGKASELMKGVPEESSVWMSHGDKAVDLADHFEKVASTENCEFAVIQNTEGYIFGVQFHPEVVHTQYGREVLDNFCSGISRLEPLWNIEDYTSEMLNKLKEKIKHDKVLLGVSGGVDSMVTAQLLHLAIGENLTCVYVDNGLMRSRETEEVGSFFRELNIPLKIVEAGDTFLKALGGVSNPEEKRKIIGRVFIEEFKKKVQELGHHEYLAQGTLYPDVIESVSVRGPSATIKSHHNRVQEVLDLLEEGKVIEPLKELFKDEVRSLGRELGIPERLLLRHPFPGPGLAVRILGEVTPKRLDILRKADKILVEELIQKKLYNKIWQAFVVFLPVHSVGVMGDKRTYENVAALRCVSSQDGMTAVFSELPFSFLEKVSNRIINEVSGINRVVYDISSKPPSTIEWE